MEKIYIITELLTSNVQKEKVKRQAIIYQFPLRILASLALLLALIAGSASTLFGATYYARANGNWINNGGTFTPASSTIIFNNTSSNQSIQGSAGTQTFNNITVAKTTRSLNIAGSTRYYQ